MSRSQASVSLTWNRFPRVSGDEPETEMLTNITDVFSPRERG